MMAPIPSSTSGWHKGDEKASKPQASSLVLRHPRMNFDAKAIPTSGTGSVAMWQASTRFCLASVLISNSGRWAPVRTTGLSSPGSRKASAEAV